MSTLPELYSDEAGWQVVDFGDFIRVSYGPPGVNQRYSEADGRTAAEAFLKLPSSIRCLKTAEDFLVKAREAGILESVGSAGKRKL